MDIIKTKIKGALLVKNNTFKDHRGKLVQSFNLLSMKKLNVNFIPSLTNITHSHRHTIRGMHNQYKNRQNKLISVISGEIQDVIIDLKKNSPTFGSYESFNISDNSGYSLLVPYWCAHGFLTKSKKSIITYQLDNIYDPINQQTIKWDDENVSIKWQINKKTKIKLSKNDKLGLSFIQSNFFK